MAETISYQRDWRDMKEPEPNIGVHIVKCVDAKACEFMTIVIDEGLKAMRSGDDGKIAATIEE
jgi:hypothetical protein